MKDESATKSVENGKSSPPTKLPTAEELREGRVNYDGMYDIMQACYPK